MALIVTLLVGGPAWWFLMWQVENSSRTARGKGAPEAWIWLWLLVTAIAVRAVVARGGRSRGRALAEHLSLGALGIIGMSVLLSQVAGDFGVSDQGAAILFGWLLLAVAIVVGGAGPLLRPLFRVGTVERHWPSPWALVGCLIPMLVPAVALLLVRSLPLAPRYEGLVSSLGLTGIMQHHLELLGLFGALIVAWGFDRSDGSRDRSLASLVPVLAVLPLLVSAMFGLSSGARLSTSLDAHPMLDAQGLINVDHLVRATSLMLLASALLSADLLRRLPARGRGPGLPALVVLFGVQVSVGIRLVPDAGPYAAALGGTLGCAAAWLVAWGWSRWVSRRRAEHPAP